MTSTGTLLGLRYIVVYSRVKTQLEKLVVRRLTLATVHQGQP